LAELYNKQHLLSNLTGENSKEKEWIYLEGKREAVYFLDRFFYFVNRCKGVI